MALMGGGGLAGRSASRPKSTRSATPGRSLQSAGGYQGQALGRREQPGDSYGPAGYSAAAAARTTQGQSGAMTDLINQIIGAQQGGYNPSSDFQNQIAMIQAGGAMNTRQAKEQAGYGRERIGIQGEQLGMQRDQLQRAMGLSPQYKALDDRNFALGYQDLDAANLAAWRGAEQSQIALKSSAAARGSTVTQGTERGFDTIQKGLQAGLEGIGRDRSRLDISKERAQLGYQEEQARFKDAGKNLDLMSKQLGISSRELETNLNNALQQIGLSTSISAGDIAKSIQAQLAGQYDPLSGITGELLKIAFGG